MNERIRIRANIEADAWRDLREMAEDSRRSVAELLTAAIREYVSRRRMRPDVLRHAEDSIEENRELGRGLAD
jgi:predicted CopG family antitoxin